MSTPVSENLELKEAIRKKYYDRFFSSTFDEEGFRKLADFEFKLIGIKQTPYLFVFDSPYVCQVAATLLLELDDSTLPNEDDFNFIMKYKEKVRHSKIEKERFNKLRATKFNEDAFSQRVIEVSKDEKFKIKYVPFFDIGGCASDYGWMALYEYKVKIGEQKPDENFDKYVELSKCNAFLIIALDRAAIICKPPLKINIDEREQLHSTAGPAVKTRDGHDLYFVNNIGFEKDLYYKFFIDKDYKFEDFVNVTNTEKRAIIIRECPDLIEQDKDSKVIDSVRRFIAPNDMYPEGVWIEEKLIDFKINNATFRSCIVQCPSTLKKHFHLVDNNCTTVLEAKAWMFQVTPAEYKTIVVES